MIEVRDMVKVYPDGTKAVSGINFAVREGEFFGFLGPNGAGKSTTLKVLSTLLKKTSGAVKVAGHDVDHEAVQVRQSIGFAMQEVGLDDLATGREFLVLQGILYKLPEKEAKRRANDLLELMGLTDAANRKVGAYSGGMRRRIDLLGALIHRPKLLFLDEPTTGLDPQSRLAIWDYLKQINKDGVTIVLTTQIMEEADKLCERLAIIDKGTIVAEGSPDSLKLEVGGDVVSISIGSAAAQANDEMRGKAKAVLASRPGVVGVTQENGALLVTVKNGSAAAPDLMRSLIEGGVPVSSIGVSEPTLDDVFLKHTGKKIRTDSASGDGVDNAMRAFMGLKKR